MVNNVVAVNRSVEHRVFFQRMYRGFDKEAHEADLHAVFFFEFFLEALAHFHDWGHVDFVERGQNGVGRLGLQQTLGHAGTQAAHGHALLWAFAEVHRRAINLRQHLGGRASWYDRRRRFDTGSHCTQHIAFGDATVLAGAND